MFIVVEWYGDYSDVMLSMNDNFDIATFKTREEAEEHARASCVVEWKVVEI